ncbi:MAG: Fe-S protein assembly co-chaperone HscB [Gammaproteobacteria bacterium]|nr:Fe-S protein assembly co-chaperone HscB [Gammaproteobacteria bacterium]
MSLDLTSNFFELFEIPVSFVIDAGLLMKRYRELQQTVHPDRFANATEQERRLSLQYATQINEALRILKDPLERARYLLQLKGVLWDDEQTTLSDPAFLMRQIELRESLEEVREKPDPLSAIGNIIDKVSVLIGDNTQVLQGLLESDNEDELIQAKNQVRKMQFLKKLMAEAESIEAAIEDDM